MTGEFRLNNVPLRYCEYPHANGRIRPNKRRLRTFQAQDAVGFDADTVLGRVHVTVYNPHLAGKALSPVANALYLDAIEDHLQFIETWLGVPLPVIPSLEPDSTLPALLALSSTGGDPLTVGLHLPPAIWQSLPDPPIDIKRESWRSKWTAYSAELVIGRLVFSDREVARMAVGSVVLLPGTFMEEWKVQLSVPELSLSLSGVLDRHTQHWRQRSNTDNLTIVDNSEALSSIEASASINLQVSAETLVGGSHKSKIGLSNDLSLYTCHLSLSTRQQFIGFLMPVANGMGIYIKQIRVPDSPLVNR